MNRIIHFIVRAVKHIQRNPFVSSVTIVTVAVVFLLLAVLFLVGHNLNRIAERLQAGLQLVVFVEDDSTADQQDQVRRTLSGSKLVASVSFVDRQSAYQRFRERLGAQAHILDGLGENPLPASFEASLDRHNRDPALVHELAQSIIDLPGVEEVEYGQSWLRRLFGLMSAGRLIALFIGCLMVFATLMVVSNTIRLSVFARQEEISILKLVGATDGFVKAPFYIEGVLLTTLGSILGVACTWVLFLSLAADVSIPLGTREGSLSVEFLPLLAVGAMVAGGAIVGFLGTLASLGRHLRV